MVCWHLDSHQQPSAQTKDTETRQDRKLEASEMLFLKKVLKGSGPVNNNNKKLNLENVN